MGTLGSIFIILAGLGMEAFLLYCLIHFFQDWLQTRRGKAAAGLRSQPLRLAGREFEVAGALSSAVWEDGEWRVRVGTGPFSGVPR